VVLSVSKDRKLQKNAVFEDGSVTEFAVPAERVLELSSFQVSSAQLLLFGCVDVSVNWVGSPAVQLD